MAFPNLFGSDVDVYARPPQPDDQPSPDPAGTLQDPYLSVSQAIAAAAGGGNVYLLPGQYIEDVKVEGVRGKWCNKIVVQPYAGEVTIDCLVTDFLNPDETKQWIQVPHPECDFDEYVWSEQFDPGETNMVTRGAFLEGDRYTRLITYGRYEDLLACEQTWNKELSTGNQIWEKNDDDVWVTTDQFLQWVYMGPGIWFGEDDTFGERRLHIRLSHTTHNIPGWDDYAGPTDPRNLRLALSKQLSRALFLAHCRHITFKDLTFRFGGRETIFIRNCRDITFDHVKIRAASRAVRLENHLPNEKNRCITLAHCEVDGGLPTWVFRSDLKDNYRFKPAGHEAEDPVENPLATTTSGVLISSGARASRVTVHHCEIFNGHDMYLFGDRMKFHHNWVHNMNDDATLIAAEAGAANVMVYKNAITQCLTAFSFDADDAGYVQIFRNLVDIREPTLGVRPPAAGVVTKSLRQGLLYKDGLREGPLDLWNNTCVALNAGGVGDPPTELPAAGFTHYGAWDADTSPRRAYNNIFVATYPDPKRSKPIAFLPHIDFEGPSDSNTYYRVGPGTGDAFLVSDPGANSPNHSYTDLCDYWKDHFPYEEHSHRHDPVFRSFDLHGLPQLDDDLRLGPGSPARGEAETLPSSLRVLDLLVGGILTLILRDRGCYGSRWCRLKVGVDGAKTFPT
jgi:hypothetical protein